MSVVAAGMAAERVSTVYGVGSDAVKGNGSTGWAIVGYSLVLILLYVLIANKRVVNATSGLVGGATTAVKAWVSPEDPIALLSSRLGHTPGAAAATSAGSSPTSSSGAAAGVTGATNAGGQNQSVGGAGSKTWRLHAAPAPGKVKVKTNTAAEVESFNKATGAKLRTG
jgi:hypothetical protein